MNVQNRYFHTTIWLQHKNFYLNFYDVINITFESGKLLHPPFWTFLELLAYFLYF